MNSSIKLFIFTAIIFLFVSNSFSTPLAGTYTIGSGGYYPTINAAVSDVTSQGVMGAVVFDIIAGSYYEQIVVNPIPGSSAINTVTFRSQTGNPNDVSIGLLWGSGINLKIFEINGASNLIIRDLTFGPNVPQGLAIYFNNSCSNVKIINNIFSESISKFVGTDIGEEFASTTNVNDIQIKDNINTNTTYANSDQARRFTEEMPTVPVCVSVENSKSSTIGIVGIISGSLPG